MTQGFLLFLAVCARATSESKWKMIIGKTVSEDAYVSELELREAYAKAMPETTFSHYNHSIMKLQELRSEFDTKAQTHETQIKYLESKVEKLIIEGKKKEEQLEKQNNQIIGLMKAVAKLAIKAKPISKEELQAEIEMEE